MESSKGEPSGGVGLPGPGLRKFEGSEKETAVTGGELETIEATPEEVAILAELRAVRAGGLPEVVPSAATAPGLAATLRRIGATLCWLAASAGLASGPAHHACHCAPQAAHAPVGAGRTVRSGRRSAETTAEGSEVSGQKTEGRQEPTPPATETLTGPAAPRPQPRGEETAALPAEMSPVLAELSHHGKLLGRMVQAQANIERHLEAVARQQYELRQENEELRRLNKEGYFQFAVRVKGEDFLAFAAIMALGNRKAAAAHLKIAPRTFYHRVDQWAQRGRDYQLMRRYMEWRKRSARQLKVALNPSLQSAGDGEQPENPETLQAVLTEIAAADNRSYPALFAEVLQALERQNAGNWTRVRQELVALIKEEIWQQ